MFDNIFSFLQQIRELNTKQIIYMSIFLLIMFGLCLAWHSLRKGKVIRKGETFKASIHTRILHGSSQVLGIYQGKSGAIILEAGKIFFIDVLNCVSKAFPYKVSRNFGLNLCSFFYIIENQPISENL